MIRLDPHSLYSTLWSQAKDELKLTWDELKAESVAALERAASDLAILVARRIRMDDPVKAQQIDHEIAFVLATIANWTWAGAARVRARWSEFLKQAAEQVGEILKHLAKGLVA